MKKHLLTLALALATSASVFAEGTTIYGVFGSGNSCGLATFDSETPGSATLIYANNAMNPYDSGAAILDGVIVYNAYGSTYQKPYLQKWVFTDIDDSSTYTKLDRIENLPVTSRHTALAVDPLSGKIYGCFTNEDGSFFLGTLDHNTGLSTKIKDTGITTKFTSMAFDDLGTLYAITLNGKLYKGNTLGDFTEVGELTLKPYASSASYTSNAAVIDPEDGTFYWSVYDQDRTYKFCTVNLETCQVTEIGSHTSSFHNAYALYIPTPDPKETAPAAITDLNVTTPSEFSKDLTITFTVPNQTVGGTTISAGLDVYLVVDGELVINGEMKGPGTTVTHNMTVTDGNHVIVAFVRSRGTDSEASAKTKVDIFAGEDVADAVSDFVITSDDNEVEISWTAPTIGANGGAFDASALTYTISLVGAEEPLATGLTECKYIYTLESSDLQTLQFVVTPVTNAGEGLSATTDKIVVGSAYVVPFVEDFNDKTLEQTFFTVYDLNADTKTWTISGNALRYSYSTSNAADDWAISAPIILRKDHEYNMSMLVKVPYTSWGNEKMEIFIGTEPTVEAMTTSIMEEKAYTTSSMTEEVSFSVESTGIYYIGFHATTDRDHGYLDLDDISITFADEDHALPTVAPAAAAALTAAAEGNTVTLTFSAPSTDAEGGEDPELDVAEIFCNDELVGKIKYPEEGAELTFVEEGKANGVYKYHVTFTNVAGTSEKTEADEITVLAEVPAAAEDLTATVDGADVTITFTVPDTDAEGNENPMITKAELFRGETSIKTWEDPEEGAELSYVDEGLENGTYTYSVVFTNAVGDSEAATAEATVDVKPEEPDDPEEPGEDSVAGVEADSVSVKAVDGGVLVCGADAQVFNAQGALVAVALDGQVAHLAPGVYVVNADSVVAKVVVK